MTVRLRRRTLFGVAVGGYDCLVGDEVVGWVVRSSDGRWHAYVPRPSGIVGREVGWGFPTRREAVDEVEIEVG